MDIILLKNVRKVFMYIIERKTLIMIEKKIYFYLK